MKTPMILKSMTLIALLGAAFVAPVFAQPGPGMGGGMGGGPGMQNSAPGAQSGQGQGGGGRGMGCRQGRAAGWSLMTQEERTAHQIKMRAVKTYDECKVLQADHRKLIEERAKEKGVTLPPPRQIACERMKERGIIQ